MTMVTPRHESLSGVAYLFGSPIAHSLSPLLHQIVFDELRLRWRQLTFDSRSIDEFMKLTNDPRFVGASVTMPHKIAIMQHLDALEPAAGEVGACNTIFVRRDPKTFAWQLIGTNTDIVGIREALYQNVKDPEHLFRERSAVIVGGGGAARSAAYALRKMMHVAKIHIVNRDAAEAEAVIAHCRANWGGDNVSYVSTVAEAEKLEDPGVIVACVPDLEPITGEEKIAQEILLNFFNRSRKGTILEMCYHPRPWTRIAEMASRARWQVILGTEAMIYQGLEQSKLWTSRGIQDLPLNRVKKAIEAKLATINANL